ncbi:hypothetical protein OH77DRAFT_1238697 [Trametes cingulata]|nr:hypothetical protein OH77DRAFT_1238697 [Trametes cingulata]
MPPLHTRSTTAFWLQSLAQATKERNNRGISTINRARRPALELSRASKLYDNTVQGAGPGETWATPGACRGECQLLATYCQGTANHAHICKPGPTASRVTE